MKITYKLLALLMISMTYLSCGDDKSGNTQNEDGSVEMVLKVTYDGLPLVLSQDYVYPDGRAMFFSRFSFYMSELTLRTEDATASSDEVSYLRLGEAHTNASAAEEGLRFNLDGVKSADYVNVSFGIGVPAELNSMAPSDFLSSNDLSLGEHWPGWNSYIFCKVEGRIDFDDDGVPETDFALHLGADEAFVNIELDRNFKVDDNQTTELIIPIELKNFFVNNGDIYDIESNPKIHSLSQQAQILELANNLNTCF